MVQPQKSIRILFVFIAILACSTGPSARSSESLATLNIPPRHPYLAITPGDIAKARQKAANHAWAKKTLDKLTGDAAREASKPLGALPAKGDEKHWSVASRLRDVGLGHAFSGSAEQAAWVRDGLLAYADLYPTLEWTNNRCRVFTQSPLYEAIWAQSIVEAYDLVVDSGVFSAEQRKHVEQDLLRRLVECFLITDYEHDSRIRDLHYRCYNFQAWHLGTVGLVGLALRDQQFVDYAVNSRYGFKHLVAHDIRDDGLFWERSVGYHHFVIGALLPFTEAMLHCGVDLYGLQVPNDRLKDEDCHYVTDTSDAPKSFRMMFETPFYMAFPDFSYIALGDSDRGPLHPNSSYLIAWNRYHDPCVGRLLRRDTGYGDRVGFLHYYRYQFEYDAVRLNGQPVRWSDLDASFENSAEKLTASDSGERQPDRFALAAEPGGQYTLEWRMTRLQDSGKDERAWLVWRVNPHNRAFRRSYYLNDQLAEVGRTYQFRLVVDGDKSQLFRDGTPVTREPQDYKDDDARDWHWLVYDTPEEAAPQVSAEADSEWRDRVVGNTGIFRNGSTLLPSSGLAVLRQTAGDFTSEPQALAVALSYGPYGGGHGHPDKLSVAVYAQGRQWIPHYGSMPYESSWKKEWTSHTISHNTVIIDGKSQQPAGKRDSMWPADRADQRVIGKLLAFDADKRLASAECRAAYPGWVLRREIRLAPRALVDHFEISPDADEPGPKDPDSTEHQFDYVLHIDGQNTASEPKLAQQSGELGQRCGYQHVKLKASARVEQPAHLDFESLRRRLRVWIVPQNGSIEILMAEGPTNSPTDLKPMLIARIRGQRASFRTLIEPLGEQTPLTPVEIQTLINER